MDLFGAARNLGETNVTLSPLGWVLLVIALCLTSWFGAYLSIKGQNLATKQDIVPLTRMVEEVKMSFAVQLEALRASLEIRHEDHAHQNRLRLAALDKRLEAHQEAYGLWHSLMDSVYSAEILEVAKRCRTWWIGNCLYLEPDVREALVTAWLAATHHRDIRRDPIEREANWNRLVQCGDLIIRATGLPGFGTKERKEFEDTGSKHNDAHADG